MIAPQHLSPAAARARKEEEERVQGGALIGERRQHGEGRVDSMGTTKHERSAEARGA
jgi:hypothetical protein